MLYAVVVEAAQVQVFLLDMDLLAAHLLLAIYYLQLAAVVLPEHQAVVEVQGPQEFLTDMLVNGVKADTQKVLHYLLKKLMANMVEAAALI